MLRLVAAAITGALLHGLAAAAQEEKIEITNHLQEDVDIWWVAPNGQENVFQGRLKQGAVLSLNTWEQHSFIAQTKQTDNVLKRFTVSKGMHTVHLTDNGSEQCSAYRKGEKLPRPPCRDHPKAANRCARYNDETCRSSPGWNIHFCTKTCNETLNACYLSDPAIRCNRTRLFVEHNVTTAPAFEPFSGGLDKLFKGLEAKWSHLGARMILSDPPIVVFDSFMTEDEAIALRESSGDNNFKRSTSSGSTDATGYTTQTTSQVRTSSNAWCQGQCVNNPTVQAIMARIENVTTVNSGNYEAFQFLRYEEGQYYRRHHDYSGRSKEHDPAGPRILTFFLYLSDVPSGGETEFPDLDPPVKVLPKVGRAVLWPSVLDDMVTQESRTFHQANPVGPNGIKYGANAWIHQYNNVIPSLWGCTGSFTDP